VTLQASSYRKGRVLLAGDAAHIHYPAGGLGLNLGVQDAVNLGWKLAQVVQGQSPETLLDTYHSEQHPVAARVLRNTMAQVVLLGRLDDRKTALREVFAELLAMDEPRKQFGAMMSGLDIHYGPDALNPLVGRRVPDIDIATAHGKARLYTLLREARPVLLNFDEPRRFDLGPWADRVRMVDSNSATTWDIPVIGPIAPPGAVLVRPDGHAAWVEHATDQSLLDALEQWFGKPASGIDAVSSLEATR
jgi:3-(3-hydroxy-phenyl)propionate hydroxylase